MCRETRKWTRSYLAEKAKMPLNTVINCERRHDCRVSTMDRLIEAMGFELEIVRKED
jgi:hypothetical protein